MNDRLIRQLAVSISLTAFAVVKFIEPQLWPLFALVLPGAAPGSEEAEVPVQLLKAAWSGIKIGIWIVILEHVLYRIFARRFLGRWAYVSSSNNYAVADIIPTGFWAGGVTLSYTVSLYKTAEEVIAAIDHGGTSSPFGTAEGLLTGFKDQKVTIVYQVSVGADSYDAQKGILTLTLTADPNIVIGVWESTKVNMKQLAVEDRRVRVGDLKLFRPHQFKKKFAVPRESPKIEVAR